MVENGGGMTILSKKHKTVRELAKVASNIAGFDEILYGGLPEGRTTLIEGGPGSGKSVLGLEFLYRGALVGQPGIFVTFEERADAIRLNAGTLGWDLEVLENADKLVGLVNVSELPSQTFRMAMAVVTVGPIIFAYPFFQRYFIRGLTIGAVKG